MRETCSPLDERFRLGGAHGLRHGVVQREGETKKGGKKTENLNSHRKLPRRRGGEHKFRHHQCGKGVLVKRWVNKGLYTTLGSDWVEVFEGNLSQRF